MADLVTQQTGAAVELISGSRGEFSVWVNEERVAQKDSRGFPAEPDVVAAVKRALGS